MLLLTSREAYQYIVLTTLSCCTEGLHLSAFILYYIILVLITCLGNPMFHMLDTMLAMFIDLPARMNPGVSISNCVICVNCFTVVFSVIVQVFLASSDIIFLYNGAGMLTILN